MKKANMMRSTTVGVTFLVWLACASPAISAGPNFDPSFGLRGTTVTRPPEHPWIAGIYDMAEDASGHLIVAGGMTVKAEQGRFRTEMTLGSYLPNGSPDSTFGNEGVAKGGFGSQSEASGVAIQPDQKIVSVGFTNWGHAAGINDKYSAAVTRLNPNGSLDQSFRSSERSFVSAARDVAVEANGRIVVAGIQAFAFHSLGVVFGLKPNGRPDRTFGKRGRVNIFTSPVENSSANLSDIIIQPDGKLLVAGEIGGRILLARLLPNGKPDTTFGGGDGRASVQFSPKRCACSAAHAVHLQSSGRIVVLAHQDTPNQSIVVARFLPNGRLDRSFGPAKQGFVRYPNGFGLGLAIQHDNKIVVAGRTGNEWHPTFTLLRYLANGRPDPDFGANGILVEQLGEKSEATSALVQPNGQVVVAGTSVDKNAEALEASFVLQRFSP